MAKSAEFVAEGEGRDHQAGAELIQPDQLWRAMGSPMRRAILHRIIARPQSSAELARAMKRPIGQIAYHAGVLERECGVLEYCDRHDRKTVSQRFRRLKPSLRFAGLELDGLPAVLKQGAFAALLEKFTHSAGVAISAGTLGGPSEAVASARPSAFDAEGWARAVAVMRAADEEIEMIEAESRGRLKSADAAPIHAVLGLALFEAGELSESLPREPEGR